MPGVIMMGAMFCLFVIEMWLNAKMGGQAHSHGGPMGLDSASEAAHGHGHGQGHGHGMVAAAPPPRPPRYNSRDSFETEDQIEYEKKIAQKM